MMSKAEIDKMESNRSEKKRSKKTIQTNRTSDICNSAKKRRTKSNIQAQICSMHKLPLSYLCDMDIICEKCSLEPPYVDRKAINLRTTSFQLLKSVEQNLTEFKNILESVEECRTVELRQNILSQIHTYFDSVEECLDIIKEEKINEVHKIFGILKFEDLDDLKLHYNLRNSAESALESISEDFKNKAFNLIYLNKNSYENINDHVESITQDLKITKKLYDERCKDLFQIEKDYEVINHQVRQMIESGCVSYGSLARPRSEINDQMKKACDSVMYDMSVVDLLNKNSVMMNQDEQKTIFNTIQAIKHSAKSLLANYGQISEYGCEIISEALKNCDSVIKLDLNGNNIGLKGCKSISDMLTINLYLQCLRLSCNNLDDKCIIQLIEGLKINKSLTTLYLNDNHITDEGAIALCDLLSTVDNESNKLKSNISCLFMDKNYIKEQGGKAFAEMLKINNNINALYLNNNCLGNKGVIAITHSVEGTL